MFASTVVDQAKTFLAHGDSNMKLTRLSKAMTAVLAFSASAAFALPVSSAIEAGTVHFSDNSAERLIDRNGNGTLDVGDSLRGIFSIGDITGTGAAVPIGAGSPVNELTGLFQVVVTGKTPAGGPNFNYTFGFDALFGQGAGVIGVLYDDAAKNYRRANCLVNTVAGCESTATGGTVWAKIGAGANTFWSASVANQTPGVGAILPFGTPLGTFGLGLDFITNNTGFTWNKVDCFDTTTGVTSSVDICGQGGVLATGRSRPGSTANTPFDIFDNVDFTANRVPEPGSMALVGVALLGLSLAARRKKST